MSTIAQRYLSVKRALFDQYYAALNERQCEAVYHVNGPLLILAGAGSGKTTVLVRRIAHIIRFGNAVESDFVPPDVVEAHVASLEAAAAKKLSPRELEPLLSEFSASPCQPWRMLAITFTNKAANEIKSRLAAAFPDDPSASGDIWAGTFHSICMRILRRHTAEAGLGDGFTVYDTEDQKKAMTAVLKALNIDEKVLNAKSALTAISHAKDKLIWPEAFAAEMGNDYRMKLIDKAYTAYQKRLQDSNALDFDDIILFTVRLFERHPAILDEYRKRFRYVSVDEYQDTNEAQFRLTALLSSGYQNLMAVGDDDQSIYKFRGATIANILEFDRVFPTARVVRLEENYRSTAYILDAANAVISHNENRKGKTLWTQRTGGAKIHILNPENQNIEARRIVDIVSSKVSRGQAHYRDFAVLYRTNAQSNALETAFARSAVPYRMLGGVRFADRKEIRDIVAYLQLINNHADRDRLLRIVNEPRRKIGDKTLAAVQEIAQIEGKTMFDVMAAARSYPALARTADTLEAFCALIERLTDLCGTMPLDRFVDAVLEESGYRQMIRDMGEEEAERLDNLEEFISNVIEYEESTEHPSLTEFLEETALVADVDRYDDTADAVVLMTIHSAKGLEFRQVFLPGFEEGIFPGLQTVMAGPAEVEEERRLAYVAITRAKDELYILHAKNRLLYGRTSANPASRFLSEIPESLLDRPQSAPAGLYFGSFVSQSQRKPAPAAHTFGMSQKPAPQKPVEVFSPGEEVNHPIFGEGVILSSQKMGADTLYEIAFETKGIKKLMASYAKLERPERK